VLDDVLLPRSPEDFSNLGPVLHGNNVLELVPSELIQVCSTQDEARNVLTYGAIHTVGVDGKIIYSNDYDSTDADTVHENIEDSDDVTNDNDLASPSHSVSRDDENIEGSDEATNAETISFGDGITLNEENLLVEVMRTQSNIDMTEYIGPIKMDSNGKGYY